MHRVYADDAARKRQSKTKRAIAFDLAFPEPQSQNSSGCRDPFLGSYPRKKPRPAVIGYGRGSFEIVDPEGTQLCAGALEVLTARQPC